MTAPPDDAQPIHSRQHGDPAVLKTRRHLPQRRRLDHLDRVAPLCQMPRDLNEATCLEGDQQPAIFFLDHFLFWVEFKLPRGSRGNRAEEPYDTGELRFLMKRPERLRCICFEVEVFVLLEPIDGDLCFIETVQTEAAQRCTLGRVARNQVVARPQ